MLRPDISAKFTLAFGRWLQKLPASSFGTSVVLSASDIRPGPLEGPRRVIQCRSALAVRTEEARRRRHSADPISRAGVPPDTGIYLLLFMELEVISQLTA